MKRFDPFINQNCFYQYDLKINSEEINQIIFLLKDDKKLYEQKSTFNKLHILNFPLLKNLRSQVINILDKNNLILDNNWAQLYNKEDKHSIHVHSLSVYSGIIYLNPDKLSPTIFYDRNFETYVHEGVKNTLLLFPSYIPHEVKPLNEDEQRLITSSNTLRSV